MTWQEAVTPSTLTYKDRLSFKDENLSEYNKLYVKGYTPTVWERLVADATVRQTSARRRVPYKEGAHVLPNPHSLSGFTTNSHPPADYTPSLSFKPGHSLIDVSGPPVETLHPIVAKRYKKRNPVDFMGAIRPDTETTVQTQRMMGTYDTDRAHAERFGVFIPHMCPGGPPSYHPDVRLTWRTTHPNVKEHPAWRTLPYGNPPKLRPQTARPQTARPIQTTQTPLNAAQQQPAATPKQRPQSAR